MRKCDFCGHDYNPLGSPENGTCSTRCALNLSEKQTERLKALNTKLLGALRGVNDWAESVEGRPPHGKLWATIRDLIRKAESEAS